MKNTLSSCTSISDLADMISSLREKIEILCAKISNDHRKFKAHMEVHYLKIMARTLSFKSLKFKVFIYLTDILSLLTKLINFSLAVFFKKVKEKALEIKAISAELHYNQNIYPLNIKGFLIPYDQEVTCPV